MRKISVWAAMIAAVGWPPALSVSSDRPRTVQSEQGVPYTIPVHVDEVNLTFSAVDERGFAIDDLELADLRLLDNGKKPERVVSFRRRSKLPIRAGLLVDTSGSMSRSLGRTRQIAAVFGSHILRQESDRAFVMRFDFEALVKQDWTNRREVLNTGIEHVAEDSRSRLGGTALFDSVYISCRDKFGNLSGSADTGNFIVLFTDGVDNVSHARMGDVIDKCQQTHTAIYVFTNGDKVFRDAGQKVLQELAMKSGGRIFYDNGGNDILSNLRLIERDIRNDYVVIYKPANFKADGSFRKIKLDCPKRTAFLWTRTGYYARH
jgi:Ca-activated chloride channel homolog